MRRFAESALVQHFAMELDERQNQILHFSAEEVFMDKNNAEPLPEPGTDAAHAHVDDPEVDSEVPHLLDVMNKASDDINTHELALVAAQKAYQSTLDEWSSFYASWRYQLGPHGIGRATQYAEAVENMHMVSNAMHQSVRNYMDAQAKHDEAKDYLENAMALGSNSHLDEVQQEIVNRSVVRLHEAQFERDRYEGSHLQMKAEFDSARKEVEGLRAKHHVLLDKCAPFLSSRRHFLTMLKTQKQQVNERVVALAKAKEAYQAAMHDLEHISETIHQRRQTKKKIASTFSPKNSTVSPVQAVKT